MDDEEQDGVSRPVVESFYQFPLNLKPFGADASLVKCMGQPIITLSSGSSS